MPSKFEAGTINIAGIISLGAAIDYISGIGFKNIQEHENKLTAYCIEKLEGIKGLKIYGPKNLKSRGNVISFSMDGIHPHDIAQILGDNNICIRSGHHCAMPLHTRLGISASARVSLSIYNTEEDIDKLVVKLKEIQKMFKK